MRRKSKITPLERVASRPLNAAKIEEMDRWEPCVKAVAHEIEQWMRDRDIDLKVSALDKDVLVFKVMVAVSILLEGKYGEMHVLRKFESILKYHLKSLERSAKD